MNEGLRALKKASPEAYENITGKQAMYGAKIAAMGAKLGLNPDQSRKVAELGMRVMKNGGMIESPDVLSAEDGAMIGGAPVLSAGDGARMYRFGGKYAQKGTVNNGDDKNGDEDSDFYELTLYKNLKNEVLPQQLQGVYSSQRYPHEKGPAIDYDSESRTYKIPKNGTREESIAAFLKEHPEVKGYEDFSEAYSEENLNDPEYMKQVQKVWDDGKSEFDEKGRRKMPMERFYVPFKMHGLKEPGQDKNWFGQFFDEGNLPEFKEDEKETPEPVKKPDPVRGCTNPKALNYNPKATEDDGSCELPPPPKKEDPVPPLPGLEPSGFNFTPDPVQQDATAVRYQGGNPDLEKLINAPQLQRMYGGKMKPLKKYGGYMK